MAKCQANASFVEHDGGGATFWMIMWFMLFVVFGGVAVDSSNGWRHRAVLQATADAAAHAAVIDVLNQDDAIAAALAITETNMALVDHGAVLSDADVVFGGWNGETHVFDANAALKDAVQVTVRRGVVNGNPLPTYFLRLAGLFNWNVGAQAVAQRYFPECLNDGLFARGMIDIRSNNTFTANICVHGQSHVEINNNNFWDPTVSVSMPNLADLTIPTGGWEHNENIEDVLREEWFDPKLVDLIGQIIESLDEYDSEWLPDYIDAGEAIIYVNGLSNFDPDALEAGRIYVINCNGPNNNINMGNGAVVSQVVLIADCKFSLGNNAAYNDVVIASTAGDPDTPQESLISVGQGTTMGSDDECTPGGGVVMLSTASLNGAADSTYHGVQIVATGNISLAAGQGAIEGLQAQAGGDISITSNNAFGACSGGVDGFRTPYYRLVQ